MKAHGLNCVVFNVTVVYKQQLPYSGLFSKEKIFTNWSYLMFSQENFQSTKRLLILAYGSPVAFVIILR